MKLFGIGLLASANAGAGLGSLKSTLTNEFQTMVQTSTVIDSDYMTKLEGYVQQDRMAHGNAKGDVRGVSLMPEGGQCGLHWSLCPNMCNLEEMIQNYFSEIVGNKMEKYQEWKTEVATKMRSITEDLEGKLHQVEGLEDELGRAGLDLEKRQELFLSLLNGHLERANQIHDGLLNLQEDFTEIGEQLTTLSSKITVAHDDCYEMAPCMAVPKCKLGVASGESCADIATNAMDIDEQGDPTLNLESAVHIIQPAGLEAKAAICEFDYQGTGFTVVQNRHNDTGRFTGDFENGFGTTVGYDDAECDVANYYLGNKYIKAITKGDSALKVTHHSGSVEQWDSVSVSGNSYNLGSGGHVCGSDTMSSGDVKLGSGGINGRWSGQTKIMIGKDRSPDMDMDCMDSGVGPTDTTYGTAGYDDYSKSDY